MMLPKIVSEHSGLCASDLAKFERKLAPEIERMRNASRRLYEDERASINAPIDPHHGAQCAKLAREHKKAQLIVVIGIGGSNLGTQAVEEAILGPLHNLTGPVQVLYADTVDPERLFAINELLERHLQAGKQVVLNIVSKSGTTTETIANFEVLYATLKQNASSPHKHVVVTTDKESRLAHLAHEEGFSLLEIPHKVGGRYSIFTSVGLFPLSLLGLDVSALLRGAARMRAKCLQAQDNPAILRAAMLAHAHESGRGIANNFYFHTGLEALGKWYRQLMGESLGKEWNAQHTSRVHAGIVPTVSIGTTDLHSMAQLYFGGPDNEFHTLFTVGKWGRSVKIPRWQRYDSLVANIQGREVREVMDAIVQGVLRALEGKPHCRIILPSAGEETIGALMQLHMMEMMYLAALFEVNPFDQPNVEAYKQETRRLLAR